jgi:hypothetical protein
MYVILFSAVAVAGCQTPYINTGNKFMVSSAIWIKHACASEFFKEHQNSRSPKDGCYLRSLKNSLVVFFLQIRRETMPAYYTC